MPKEYVLSDFESIETVSSSSDSDVSIIRQKETGEYFLLKSLKDRPGTEKGGIDRKIRFKREMDFIASLEHPNIARPAFWLGPETGDAIAYPYRKGRTLTSLLEFQKNMFPLEALQIALQLLDGLEYIHNRGIIHCDVNPNNIYIDEAKGVQLLDFGMSMTEVEAFSQPEGRIIGTLPWLSPEQMGFTGFKIDTRSDLYCAALILYRMLAGRTPFYLEKNTVEELLHFSLRTEVQPLRKMPSPINAILLKALRPTPAERYQTAIGFKHDLAAAVEVVKNEKQEHFVPGIKDSCVAVNRTRLFVSRAHEIEALKDGLTQLLFGWPASFCIYGKSGIGKTEIVREFRRNTPENEFFFVSSKCNPFTPRRPFALFRRIMLEYILKINSGPKEQAQTFADLCEKELIDNSGVICKIVPEMGLFFKQVRPIDLVEPEKEADRIVHVLYIFLSTICSFKPLVIFIDDLQWIDRVSFEIIRRILKNEIHCMVISTYRTERSEEELRLFGFDLRKCGIKKFFPVRQFNRSEIRDLIVLRFGEVAGADTLAGLLTAKTDSSPFALSEAFRFLVNNSYLNIGGSGWSLSPGCELELPEKLDPLALILDKKKMLKQDELAWLETASLTEGKFQPRLVEQVAGFSPAQSCIIIDTLEQAGFLVPQFGGGYCFAHDKIQDSVRSDIAKERQLDLYEKFGVAYEAIAQTNKDYLSHAAESYQKSRNLSKAIELSCRAARYASENAALDIASRYFAKTQLMVSQCATAGITPPIDTIRMQIEYGDVLALSGRNEQALKLFQSLLREHRAYKDTMVLELKYKIGCIYHFMGEFEKSIPFFIDTINHFHIYYPSNKFALYCRIIGEIVIQFVFPPFLFPSFLRKLSLPKQRNERDLLLGTLNKLTYSMYFFDMIACLYAHFKAMNLADRMENSITKAEAYTLHGVVVYQMLRKKRALKYLQLSARMCAAINRKNGIGFAECFSGLVYYFKAAWEKSTSHIKKSIELFHSIGDFPNQILSSEHLWRIDVMRGNMASAQDSLHSTIDLCKYSNEKHYLMTALSAQYWVNTITLKKTDPEDFIKICRFTESVSSYLSKTHVANFIVQTEIALLQIKEAYERVTSLLKLIKIKNANSEYNAGFFASICEIIAIELGNRKRNQPQLSVSNKKLVLQFFLNALIHWFSCISFPAYWGSLYRNIASFCAITNHRRLANHFFRKAIKHYHALDMKYEEAKSLRDFALFHEQCSQSGVARDLYNQAYRLFDKCGARLETSRIEGKVDADLVRHVKPAVRRGDTTSNDAADRVRVDTLYNASLALTSAANIDDLLRSIVVSLINATGAQYGLLHLESDDFNEPRELAVSFENRELARGSISFPSRILDTARTQRRIVSSREPALALAGPEPSRTTEGSVMCVPLVRGEKYFGCVCLANTLVSGLFSESTAKTAQIIAAQASFLLENARLLDSYKRLNDSLEQKAKEQTQDIRDKNKALHDSNLRLIESERMKDLLTGTVVHDIKNFAAAISGNIRLLSYKYNEDARAMRSVDLVVESCADIVNLASNLLDISKMEEGRLVLQQRLVYFEEIAAIAQKYGRSPLFDEKKIAVSIAPPASAEFAVLADPYLMERVIQNLYSNAAKYTNAGGTVKLSFDEWPQESQISLSSSGPLIPTDQKVTIFEKYGRVDGKPSQYSKGLGLFFCKMVMTAHHGRIWLDTNDEGNHFRLGFRKI